MNFREISLSFPTVRPIRSRQKSSSAAEIQRLQVKREGEREREAQSGFERHEEEHLERGLTREEVQCAGKKMGERATALGRCI